MNAEPNEEYVKFAPKWKRVRDVMGGIDAMREAGEAYLPPLGNQDKRDYHSYLNRAHFLGATARTEQAFLGMLFKTSIQVEDGEAVADWLADIDLQDADIDALGQEIASEILQTNRVLAVVNYSTGVAPRPYVELWKAEQILDWKAAFVNGAHALAYVKLYEGYVEYPDSDKPLETVRELRLDPIDETGRYRYTVQRFRKITEKSTRGRTETKWQALEAEIPVKQGDVWPFIPCYLFGPRRGYDCANPPLLNLADLNISHWRTAADLEHGSHYTALPTPYITGADATSGEFTIGPSHAWMIENAQAKVGFLEFTGQGLGALERLLDRKQAMMAAEGARMLAPEKSQVESGHALQLRQGAEFASLNTLAAELSQGLTALLYYMADWAGLEVDLTAQVNTNWSHPLLSAQEITALLAAWQGGAISLETFLYNMRRGGRINDQRTDDDELEAIRDGDMAGQGGGSPADTGDDLPGDG